MYSFMLTNTFARKAQRKPIAEPTGSEVRDIRNKTPRTAKTAKIAREVKKTFMVPSPEN